MSLFTITERGNVVLSADLLRQLGVRPGARIEVQARFDGCVLIAFERAGEASRASDPQ